MISAPEFYYKVQCYYGDFTSKVVESYGGKGDTKWTQTVDVLVTEPDLESLKVNWYTTDCNILTFFAAEQFATCMDLTRLWYANFDLTDLRYS